MFAVVGCFFRWVYVDVREVTFWACDGLGGWGGYGGDQLFTVAGFACLSDFSAREADRREGGSRDVKPKGRPAYLEQGSL